MKKKAIFCLLLCFVMLTPVVALAAGENQQAAENILQNSMATTFAVIHTGDTNGALVSSISGRYILHHVLDGLDMAIEHGKTDVSEATDNHG